jgi:hypothetical protein
MSIANPSVVAECKYELVNNVCVYYVFVIFFPTGPRCSTSQRSRVAAHGPQQIPTITSLQQVPFELQKQITFSNTSMPYPSRIIL